jgi:release factor glutamine methyltransferase
MVRGHVPDWTTLAVLDWTAKKFAERGIEAARLEAQVLLAHALGCSRVQLYTGFDKPLGEPDLAPIRALIKRRLAGEPIAYLVGEQEFWSLPFAVDASVLIPRRDTETVIELVLAEVAPRGEPWRGIDLCTGSGAIAVTLARELPASTWIATDLSAAAAAIATTNATRNLVGDRVTVAIGDLWAAVAADATFDLIVSNPPYVRTADIAGLDAEVRREPRLALDGGADGLDLVRRLLAGAAPRHAPGGLLAIEHGWDQDAEVRALIDATDAYAPAATRADLGGRPRVSYARRR